MLRYLFLFILFFIIGSIEVGSANDNCTFEFSYETISTSDNRTNGEIHITKISGNGSFEFELYSYGERKVIAKKDFDFLEVNKKMLLFSNLSKGEYHVTVYSRLCDSKISLGGIKSIVIE